MIKYVDIFTLTAKTAYWWRVWVHGFHLVFVLMWQQCSHLCLQGQLVGYLHLSQLQGQFKLVFWVSGHSQGLLPEALHGTRRNKKHILIFLFHTFCSIIRLLCKAQPPAAVEDWMCETVGVKTWSGKGDCVRGKTIPVVNIFQKKHTRILPRCFTPSVRLMFFKWCIHETLSLPKHRGAHKGSKCTCFSKKWATLILCSLGIVGRTLSAVPKSLLMTAVWYSSTDSSREKLMTFSSLSPR